MDENTIVVTDELGNEVEYEILFTFENEENGHQYVVYFDPEKDEPEAQAAIFDDEGGLFPLLPLGIVTITSLFLEDVALIPCL